MQVSNFSVARLWKLEAGQASRQASRASRLWKLEQNNMTKKGPFFGPQNVRKSRRAKRASPVTVGPNPGGLAFAEQLEDCTTDHQCMDAGCDYWRESTGRYL